ncbi:MAG: cryptochrome/photolyase family protein [Alphaproteobacteria bacterium]|nr:cryptochrome/photolyase family protein [Alphaproteobacteria bacterium]
MPNPNLILVLGDQLTLELSSLRCGNSAHDVVLMAEVGSETRYVKHHKKKIAFLFSAMRHFAQSLREQGWRVIYRKLDQTGSGSSFTDEVSKAVREISPARLIVTEPGEWRVLQEIESWNAHLPCAVDVLQDDRFICSRGEFAAWADGRKQLRMEYFYREMRRKTGLLMDGDEPAGGQWNYDHDNRSAAKPDLFMPQPLRITPDAITQDVMQLVARDFSSHFGNLEPFWFAVTRHDALCALDGFIEKALPRFGDYQDAMLEGQRFLYHSVLSVYMNAGLLSPMEICQKVERAWREGHVPLNAAEGYIRQIIGWREYIRGIYWLKMPDYVKQNFFAANRPVPDFYWTAETRMACLRAAITQTKEEAYAHHIQRLMLTGNFALLAGVLPHALHEWYLMVYADAYEWVELPNTLGMSQFADGGLLASKPYVSSGAYINRMSDHCKHCAYDVKDGVGENACPFNSLYWAFLEKHRPKLSGNPRMMQMYRTWDKMDAQKRTATLQKAQELLDNIDSL